MKRIIFSIVFCLLMAGMAFAAGASDPNAKYPDRPVNLIISQTPGGATEAACRVWQPAMEKELGVPLNFEFVPGANGQIAMTRLARSNPDGYNLMAGHIIGTANSIILQDPEYTYDSFEYIVNIQRDPAIIMAHKDEPYNTLSELIAYAKTRPPESLVVGVPAINDVNVIGLRQLEEATGVKFNIVSFDGGGRARTALAGHQIPLGAFMYFGSTTVKNETKLLGVNVDRSTLTVEALKGLQTFNEVAGKKMDDIFSILQVMCPAGFKAQYPDRNKFLVDAFRRAFESAEFKETLRKMEQEDWLYPIYGDDNIPFNAQLREFCERTAYIITTK